MTKIDVISGFLGAGKTTFIKKLITEVFTGEKVVLIENEFGEIGIDSGFLKEGGIEITEMNSGCICCSLVGDFEIALNEVITKYSPDRVIIEPSGVGKLSDVISAVGKIDVGDNVVMSGRITVVDVKKCMMYMKNFGEFFNNQIENATTIVLSRTQGVDNLKIGQVVSAIKQRNCNAVIVTTPWDELGGEKLKVVIEGGNNLEESLINDINHNLNQKSDYSHGEEECECGHHHGEEEECECGHHHGEGEECECGHHHVEKEECGCGHHHGEEECECGHHHVEKEECGCGHHHGEGEECECGHHHVEKEECGCGHHHADEVFTSWGIETTNEFDRELLTKVLDKLANTNEYGVVLRAKGILKDTDNKWFCFDLVSGEYEVRDEPADYTGRLCVIGTRLDKDKLSQVFN